VTRSSTAAAASKEALLSPTLVLPTESSPVDRAKTLRDVLQIRAKERIWQSKALWMALLVLTHVMRLVGAKRQVAKLVQLGQRSAPFQNIRKKFGQISNSVTRVILSDPTWAPNTDYFIAERMCVLKKWQGDRERGVIHIKFSETISALPKIVDIAKLSHYYRLVLEPSWTGLCDPGILQYGDLQRQSVVMAPDPTDYEFISSLQGKLVPISLGPCDWVDPRVAEPYLAAEKRFDLVMNSNWAPWKRHHVLFDALSRMNANLRVALIGGPWNGGTLQRIADLARYYGLRDQVSVFQTISFPDVMRVVAASRCAVLMSLKEGANRSLAEAMFCNVPVLLLDEHVGGIRKNVVQETGVRVPEKDLVRGLATLIQSAATLNPRAWAERHISCTISSLRLNELVSRVAKSEGEDWTSDIAVRANSPESTYFSGTDEESLRAHNGALQQFLRKSRACPIPD
jgi:glycosyltransferase involved in cell wall biosynthesis